jgi:epoxyqueuosine reductase
MLTAPQIKDKGRSLGFDVVGVSPIGPFPESAFYSEWLDKGYGADMHYLEKQEAAKMTPDSILPGARSVIVCAVNYNVAQPRTTYDRMRVWVSRYAWGEDYHESIKEKVRELAGWIEQQSPQKTRAYVDTGPLLERVYAKYAGIGWFGKNTCIINSKAGSWLFLGCILTDLDLATDSPAPDRCGTCTRCIDACPTHAIVEPYVLDSRKCIAYTTIELRGEMPEADREGIGHHLFGCDICQDVCPWNRGIEKRRADRPLGEGAEPVVSLREWLESDPAELSRRYDRLYVPRNDGRFLQRNARIALENTGREQRASLPPSRKTGQSRATI